MKSKLEIYALAVCFAAVFILITCIGLSLYSLCQIAAPSVTMNAYTYDQFQSNDAFWKSTRSYTRDEKEATPRPSEAELTDRRTKGFDLALRAEQRGGFQTLLKCLMFIVTSCVALWVHWKIGRQARVG